MVMLSRRRLLVAGGLAGGGLVLGVHLLRATPPPVAAEPGSLTPNAFIQIRPDSSVRFYCPRDEMGQGVTTGLTTLVAEELDVAPESIIVEFAAVHPDYDNPAFGVQSTGGSTSMNAHFWPLRQAGANARALIVAAASKNLGVPR